MKPKVKEVHSSDNPYFTGDVGYDRDDCNCGPENGNFKEPNFELEFQISYDNVEDGVILNENEAQDEHEKMNVSSTI